VAARISRKTTRKGFHIELALTSDQRF